MSASIAATFLSKPAAEQVLSRFAARVRPIGFWNGLTAENRGARSLAEKAGMWALGVAGTICGMFSIGYLLMGNPLSGLMHLAVSTVCLAAVVRRMK